MNQLVALQLNRTIETFQATLADTSIADAVFQAGEITAKAMLSAAS